MKKKEKKAKAKREEKPREEGQLSEAELEGVAGGGGNSFGDYGAEFASSPPGPNIARPKP